MKKLFLDTNIYIIGLVVPSSPEEQILKWLGYYDSPNQPQVQVIISQELINQILRVGKRLNGKDWAAKIVDQIWCNLDCLFVPESKSMKLEASKILAEQSIPAEDIFIYLTAKYGQTDCFVSANRKLIKAIADFECLNAQMFKQKYIN